MIKMISRKVTAQREAISADLARIVAISMSIDEVMRGERHNNNQAYRALDRKGAGWVIHFKTGGFSGEYTSPDGKSYEITVALGTRRHPITGE